MLPVLSAPVNILLFYLAKRFGGYSRFCQTLNWRTKCYQQIRRPKIWPSWNFKDNLFFFINVNVYSMLQKKLGCFVLFKCEMVKKIRDIHYYFRPDDSGLKWWLLECRYHVNQNSVDDTTAGCFALPFPLFFQHVQNVKQAKLH